MQFDSDNSTIQVKKNKKTKENLINKNYKAQQLDFSVNTHPMNKPINSEKERNKGSQRF